MVWGKSYAHVEHNPRRDGHGSAGFSHLLRMGLSESIWYSAAAGPEFRLPYRVCIMRRLHQGPVNAVAHSF